MFYSGIFVAVDGENCEFPVYYSGILHHECVDVYGVPSCRTKGGVWKECVPASKKAAEQAKKGKKSMVQMTERFCPELILI